MWNPNDIRKFDFGDSAKYRIVVQGCLEESFSERLGGMRITTSGCEEQAPVTVLEGRLIDQAELSGVLNSLYEMHLPILSVKVLPDES